MFVEKQERRIVEGLAWLGALVVIAFLLVVVGFRTQDPDSGFHVALVARLSTLPVSQWIAPQWGGTGIFQGLYREHPIGIVLLPLLLQKIGYPLAEAPFLANAIYQVLALLLIQRVAAFVASPMEARSAGWLVLLLPIAFTYRIRANHEDAVLMFFLAALWATQKSRTNARWMFLVAAAACSTFLIKGIFVGPLLMGCVVWLLTIHTSGGTRRAWLGIAIAIVATLTVIAVYESLYRATTGESFLSVYLSSQLGPAVSPRGEGFSVLNKARNLISYTGRVLWFAFPGSVAAVVALWPLRYRRVGKTGGDRSRDGLRFAVCISALYVLIFSISDRIADRYLFAVYFILGACGWIVLLRASTRFYRLAERIDRYQPWLCPAAWLLFIGVNLIGGALGVPLTKL